MTADLHLDNHGTISVLYPATPAADSWVEDHLPAAAIFWGTGVVIEHRFVRDIVVGIVEAGLAIAGGEEVR